MTDNFFAIINNKVFNTLESRGYTKNKVESDNDNEQAALFTGENDAYTVIYYRDVKHVVLRTCAMTEEGPDNEWKTLATWMFDPATDGEKQAESIGNDFAASLAAPIRKRATPTKKKRKSDDGNADPLFFSKRMVNVFPELKYEIKDEQNGYSPFRGVTFARKFIVPKVNALLSSGNVADIQKMANILSAQYNAGDLDTRSIITMVVLNSIDNEQNEEKLRDKLSEDLVRAWQFGKGFKGKKVKPEKFKPKKKTMAERLAGADGK